MVPHHANPDFASLGGDDRHIHIPWRAIVDGLLDCLLDDTAAGGGVEGKRLFHRGNMTGLQIKNKTGLGCPKRLHFRKGDFPASDAGHPSGFFQKAIAFLKRCLGLLCLALVCGDPYKAGDLPCKIPNASDNE